MFLFWNNCKLIEKWKSNMKNHVFYEESPIFNIFLPQGFLSLCIYIPPQPLENSLPYTMAFYS